MKKNILIVDDDEIFRNILARNLPPEKFEWQMACCRREFLEKAAKGGIDIILLDVMLGEDNGPLIYSELLAGGFDRSVPVIFLSTLTEAEPPEVLSNGRRMIMHSKFFGIKMLIEEIENLTAPSAPASL